MPSPTALMRELARRQHVIRQYELENALALFDWQFFMPIKIETPVTSRG